MNQATIFEYTIATVWFDGRIKTPLDMSSRINWDPNIIDQLFTGTTYYIGNVRRYEQLL